MDSDALVTYRFPDTDGTVTEVQITPAQALDLNAGQPLGFITTEQNAQLLVDDDGTIVSREDARPTREAA